MKKKNRNKAMNTIGVIPSPKANAKNITGLVKESGKICGYQLSNGQVVDKAKGVKMAKQGEINGVGISSRYGSEYLKGLPDSKGANNLSGLPTVQ